MARAEARVHGISPEEVHFHEVGAIDSIIDVVAAMICIEDINIMKYTPPPCIWGKGSSLRPWTNTVPAPAVLEILQGVPVYTTGLRTELTTTPPEPLSSATWLGNSAPCRKSR
ncbi:MAG: nickel insertion protein [Syntrophomonadaceae bacterium]